MATLPAARIAATAALFACLIATAQAEERKAPFDLAKALERRPTTAKVLERRADFRLQILVTEVADDGDGQPRTRTHELGRDAEYVYPASAIKLFGAIAAVQRLEELQRARPELSLDTPLAFEPLFDGEAAWREDASNLDGRAVTLRHEVRKLFLVSDNAAYNRCFEYAGRDELHAMCAAAGLGSVRAIHRLSVARTEEQNRQAPRILWRDAAGEWRELLAARTGALAFEPLRMRGFEVGDRWARDNGEIVDKPMDFSRKNRVALGDLQAGLALLVDPRLGPQGSRGWSLGDEHRAFLLATAAEDPARSSNPRYESKDTTAERYKFMLKGLSKHVPRESLLYANKIGRAYGFSTENAWVRDTRSGKAFLATATLYTNADGTLNDNRYEYEQVADPFFEELGDLLGESLLAP